MRVDLEVALALAATKINAIEIQLEEWSREQQQVLDRGIMHHIKSDERKKEFGMSWEEMRW